MGRQRSPNRDRAYEMWKESNGTKPLKSIAEELGEPETLVRKWKCQDKWDSKSNVTERKEIRYQTQAGRTERQSQRKRARRTERKHQQLKARRLLNANVWRGTERRRTRTMGQYG